MLVQIVAHYDTTLETIVATDSSNTSFWSCDVSYPKRWIKRPVYYESRSLTPTEQNYAVIEKEALAMA